MLLNNKHYYNLSSEERKDLWKHYKKAYPNMGYSDMVNHFHGEVENYQFGGRTDYFNSDVKKYQKGGKDSPFGGKEDKYVAERDVTATKLDYERLQPKINKSVENLSKSIKIVEKKFKPTAPNLLAKGLINQYPQRYGNYTVNQFGSMLDSIAQVETKNKNIKQDSGGPGRGYYQLENRSMPTAINRYNNYKKLLKEQQNIDLPEINMPINNDARKLTKDEQAALSLANMSAAYSNKIGSKKQTVPLDPTRTMETWINYHWAGKDKYKEDRMEHWNETFPKAARPLPKTKKPTK